MAVIRVSVVFSLVASFTLITPAWSFQSGLEQYEGPSLSDNDMKIAVGYIESHVHLPKGAKRLNTYGRYYAQRNGIVYAAYATPWQGSRFSSGTHIVSYNDLPVILDGGCSFIDVIYLPKIRTISANCHGLA